MLGVDNCSVCGNKIATCAIGNKEVCSTCGLALLRVQLNTLQEEVNHVREGSCKDDRNPV